MLQRGGENGVNVGWGNVKFSRMVHQFLAPVPNWPFGSSKLGSQERDCSDVCDELEPEVPEQQQKEENNLREKPKNFSSIAVWVSSLQHNLNRFERV